MRTLSNIIKGWGVLKTVGGSQPRAFLTDHNSNRNIWSSKRRYAY